jgi:ubiquinone/menaquinone biosynthesis C-methylase UbiE
MPQFDDPSGPSVARGLLQRAGGFAFSATPMLLVDPEGRVAEINGALSELTGTDLAGVVGAGLDVVSERLRPRASGAPLPADRPGPPPHADRPWRPGYDQVGITTSDFVYDSRGYGPARLQTTCVPLLDPGTGAYLGAAINFSIRKLGEPELYARALRERWARENMWVVYAVSYDQILNRMPFYREAVDRHVEALRAAGAMRILDVGAGTGNVAVELLDDGREVVAVDVSRAMLERVRSKVGGPSERRLTVVLDTAEHLPQFPDQSFDGVSALLSLFDMDEPRLALAEAVRLLRPGGTLVITDPKACFNVKPLAAEAERQLRESGSFEQLKDDYARVSSVAPSLESRIQAHSPGASAQTAGRSWSAEQILETLRHLGFTGLTFRDSHLGNCATIVWHSPQGPGQAPASMGWEGIT